MLERISIQQSWCKIVLYYGMSLVFIYSQTTILVGHVTQYL